MVSRLRLLRRRIHRLHRNRRGATTLEWTLLLGAIAIPSYAIILLAMRVLIGFYHMTTAVTAAPFP